MTTALLLGEPLPVELMNTVNGGPDGPVDALAESGVAAWLRAIAPRLRSEEGLTLDPAADTPALVSLRNALRSLAADLTDDSRTPPPMSRAEALSVLNDLAHAHPQLVWPSGADPQRTLHADGTPTDHAVAVLAQQAINLFAGDQRDRLRACQGPNCLLFFVKDHPRRAWCTPACGNRARVQRHYHRHHPKTGA